MKRCDLCRSRATSYCEADMAYLCWDCDAKVHGANFLVAKHERGLLCGACQSLSPWRASGSARLGHASSLCPACAPTDKTSKDGGPATEEEEEEEVLAPHQGPPPSPLSDGTSSSPSTSSSSCASSAEEARGDLTKRCSSSSPNRTCSPRREGNNGSSTDHQGPKPSTTWERARVTLTPR